MCLFWDGCELYSQRPVRNCSNDSILNSKLMHPTFALQVMPMTATFQQDHEALDSSRELAAPADVWNNSTNNETEPDNSEDESDHLGDDSQEPVSTSFQEHEQFLSEYNRLLWQRSKIGGIHGCSINPSGTCLAISGHKCDGNSAFVLDLDDPCWRTVCRARWHTDWIFGVTWISDTHFVTAGRDAQIALWDITSAQPSSATSPNTGGNTDIAPVLAHTQVHANAKVRTNNLHSQCRLSSSAT